MSVFAANEIRTWLSVTRQIPYTIADDIQSAVLSLETTGRFTARDEQMIFALERTLRPTMDFYRAIYPSITNEQLTTVYNLWRALPGLMRHFVQKSGMQEEVGGKFFPAEDSF